MTGTGRPSRIGAVVLAGGTGARLGGLDKGSIQVHGVTLLERALTATMATAEVVVVGPPVPTTRPVTWTVEDPPSGGPAAGLLSALDRFASPPELVAVLAVDMPRVGAATIARLAWAVEADPAVDGAVLRDASGRVQMLAAVYRLAALVAARPASPGQAHGMSMRRLVAGMRLVEIAAIGDEARDVDTWADLDDLREPPDDVAQPVARSPEESDP